MKAYLTFACILLMLGNPKASAQDSTSRVLSVQDIFGLAEQNSKQLAISKYGINISRQQLEIAKSARLPEISASADAEYLSNALILNPNFSHNETVAVPHFGNNFSLEASQTLFKGFSIKNNIAKASLQEELSKLNYDQDKETIKMLLLSRYLDLYKLMNQQKVYQKNIELAKVRLKNITDLKKEGMVTKNDMIRSELQITDLTVLQEEVNSNIAIINKELCLALGVPGTVRIQVDTLLAQQKLPETTYEEYLKQAFHLRPSVKANSINEQIAEKNISLAKAAKLPTLTLFAGDAMTRPYMYILPPQDIYTNLYQAGFKLQYHISSLYHAREHINLARIEKSRQQKQSELVEQQAELDVNASFIKYNEAKNELLRREKGRQLADDNYRIVEKKYLNQLALLTDILDASSAKLAAELNQSNAAINIIYQWYQLQKATGNLK